LTATAIDLLLSSRQLDYTCICPLGYYSLPDNTTGTCIVCPDGYIRDGEPLCSLMNKQAIQLVLRQGRLRVQNIGMRIGRELSRSQRALRGFRCTIWEFGSTLNHVNPYTLSPISDTVTSENFEHIIVLATLCACAACRSEEPPVPRMSGRDVLAVVGGRRRPPGVHCMPSGKSHSGSWVLGLWGIRVGQHCSPTRRSHKSAMALDTADLTLSRISSVASRMQC
jgi:hypothetical protein